MNTKKNGKYLNGFTLIEVLVVIAILVILATVTILSLAKSRAQARDAKRLSDLREVQGALNFYYLDHGKYPEQGCELGNIGCGCNSFLKMGGSAYDDIRIENNNLDEHLLVKEGYLAELPIAAYSSSLGYLSGCFQYQNDYTEDWCGGEILDQPNYVILYNPETNLGEQYPKWNGGEYVCISS